MRLLFSRATRTRLTFDHSKVKIGLLVHLVHLFVCFARVNLCPFPVPLGARDWLRLLTVTLPGLFC